MREIREWTTKKTDKKPFSCPVDRMAYDEHSSACVLNVLLVTGSLKPVRLIIQIDSHNNSFESNCSTLLQPFESNKSNDSPKACHCFFVFRYACVSFNFAFLSTIPDPWLAKETRNFYSEFYSDFEIQKYQNSEHSKHSNENKANQKATSDFNSLNKFSQPPPEIVDFLETVHQLASRKCNQLDDRPAENFWTENSVFLKQFYEAKNQWTWYGYRIITVSVMVVILESINNGYPRWCESIHTN